MPSTSCSASGLVGVRKPEREIFELAVQRCGASIESAWMIGDNPTADIGGAARAGIKSAWIHHAPRWTELAYRPDLVAASIDKALDGSWAREPGLGSHITADLT